jgi:PhzF family phenazine biosynthesis protein
MPARTVRFRQVDVFTSVAFKGNPLAVVFDADDLSTDAMQAIARWTNLSETTFLLRPTDPAADYRVRIFTTSRELPFAGHPTLGTAHALLESGYTPKQPGRLVQQCGVGLVPIVERDTGAWAFAAPPARIEPLGDAQLQRLDAAFGQGVIDFSAPPCAVDNGVPWLVVRLNIAADVLALAPDRDAMTALVADTATLGLAAYGPHAGAQEDSAAAATFELRALLYGAENAEDPVTGSANAALACLLSAQNRQPGRSFTVRQGTVIGRDGRIFIDYDHDGADARAWIGGHTVTVVEGTFRL